MDRKRMLIGLLLCAGSVYGANTADLKDILSGKFSQYGVGAMNSMKDGEHYTASPDGKMIVKYQYKTGNPVDTLFNVETAKECPFKRFDGYSFSEDEKKILIYTDREGIYRRSFKANYYTFEIKRNLVKPLSEGGKQQVATFSPDGRMVAFVRDNNIYLKKLDYNTESAITTDGAKNKILNGIPDWVYEEEFACVNSLA